MPVCQSCGVEIDEGVERCPLCQIPLGRKTEGGGEAPSPVGSRRAYGEASKPLTRRRLWEIVSLFAGASAAVVLAADFAYSMTVTWARYPLVSIIFLWATGSLLLLLRRHRALLFVAETAALAIFLQALDLLVAGKPWFLTFALPLTVLGCALFGGVAVVAQALRPRVFAILAVVLACASLFVVGLEITIGLYLYGAFRMSWSIVVFGCVAPLVGLLLYIQYRLKATTDGMKKIFHL